MGVLSLQIRGSANEFAAVMLLFVLVSLTLAPSSFVGRSNFSPFSVGCNSRLQEAVCFLAAL
jgi:hypothetical protein